MTIKDYLSVAPEIQQAIDEGRPVVALESTILSHGMPYPENLEFAHNVEKIVRGEGAVPATTAIIGGKLKVGLNAEELEIMCKANGVGKVSRRDVAVYLATGKTGATTVATTMLIASLAGIRIFATGGIGGVHRGATETMDISADLQELAHMLCKSQCIHSYINIFLNSTGQSANRRPSHCFRNLNYRIKITRTRYRESCLNHIYPQCFQCLCYLNLFHCIQLATRNLFAIPQGGIKNK